MKELKTIKYKDEINDDFAGTNIKTKQTPENFKYIHKNIFYRFFGGILYWIIAKPLVALFTKISSHQKFVNKKILKKYRKQGYLIYANHTLIPEDAFIPNMLTWSKRNYIIVGPDAISIPGIRTIVTMLGGYPIPASIKTGKTYLDGIDYLLKHNNAITIYPEAHIWPYYTKIREFKDVSFNYAYTSGVPVFSLTNTYVKSRNKLRKKPKVITYIQGPFFADQSLPRNESILKLRNEVRDSMVKVSESVEQIEYKFHYEKEKAE